MRELWATSPILQPDPILMTFTQDLCLFMSGLNLADIDISIGGVYERPRTLKPCAS